MMSIDTRKLAPRLLALVAAFAIFGCASVPVTAPELDADAKAFRPVAGMSAIYLFRDENLGAASPITVSLDDQVAGQTAAWTYLRWIVPPGRHRITSYAGNIASLEIVTEPGELYFVRQDVKLGFPHPYAQLRVVDPERGQRGVLASRRVVDLLAAP